MFFRTVKRLALIGGLCFFIFQPARSNPEPDPQYPVIGKPCPDFLLTSIKNYSVRNKSVHDFKGKPFILDFFTFGCSSCFENFPKINKLKKVFGDSLNILLVGKEDKGIRLQYEKFENRYGLSLPVCYTDHIFEQLGIVQVPFVLWVDGRGIVRAISDCTDLNPENIRRFLNNQPFDFLDWSHEARQLRDLSYDWRKPLLVHDNGGNDTSFLFRSLLCSWNPGIPIRIPAFLCNSAYNKYGYMKKNRFQVTGAWLSLLYQLAYGDTLWQTPSLDLPNTYGSHANKPELLMQDTSAFSPDFKTGRGIYCYSLTIPPWKSGTPEMQQIMQKDLENYFDYRVSVVEKPSPCWVIRADSTARRKLKSKGGPPHFLTEERTEINYTNAPMKALVILLYMSYPNQGPFIDETDIEEKVDFHLDVFPDEGLEKISEGLKKYGLGLFKTFRNLKVIEVRDRNPVH